MHTKPSTFLQSISEHMIVPRYSKRTILEKKLSIYMKILGFFVEGLFCGLMAKHSLKVTPELHWRNARHEKGWE